MAKIKQSLIKDIAAHTARMRGESIPRRDCYYTCCDCVYAQEPQATSVTVKRGRKGRIYCRVQGCIRKDNSIGCLNFVHVNEQYSKPNP